MRPPVHAATSTDGPQAGKQPGADTPWAFQRQAHWEMPAQPQSVPAARRCTALLLSSWGVAPEDVEQIVLLVSELTTNSTLHGRRDMSVDLSLAGSHVDLTVSDYGPVVHGRAEKLPPDECGRGLEIVSALADGLHVQRHRTGTNAWASYRLLAVQR
ncbi:ATP-binding protein [Streptacidiphilus sp. 4-A2]|nr:ATP-binding protein [Streptacidiphilus sp. 4-A2]